MEIDPKYIVNCDCGTTFVHYYTKGNKRQKCDACILKKRREWHNKNNAKVAAIRTTLTCACGKVREVSLQYANALNSRGNNRCSSCARKQPRARKDKIKYTITCTKCSKLRVVSYSTYTRSLTSDNICTTCAGSERSKKTIERKKPKRYAPSNDKEITARANAIKEREKNMTKIEPTHIIFKTQDQMNDELKKMQDDWLSTHKVTVIKSREIDCAYSSGQQMILG